MEHPRRIWVLHQYYFKSLISVSFFAYFFLEKSRSFCQAFLKSVIIPILILRYGELDEERHIIGLIFGVQRGAVAAYLAAFCAFVDYNEAFFCVWLSSYRLKLSAAFVCSVARVYVNVQGPQTKRAMVSRRVSERVYLFSAMNANKGIIVFGKSFLFHSMPRISFWKWTGQARQGKPQAQRPLSRAC